MAHPRIQEATMRHPLPQPPMRQQRLAFAQDDMWEKLPLDRQAECLRRLIQLVRQVVVYERQTGGESDERQDPV
jgi:hypothetical protein